MDWLIASIKRLIEKFSHAFEGLWQGILYDHSISIQILLATISVIFFSYLNTLIQPLKMSVICWFKSTIYMLKKLKI